MKVSIVLVSIIALNLINIKQISTKRKPIGRNASKPLTSSCGQSSYTSSERIIGGRPARDGEFPWLTSIYNFRSDGVFTCGGSIIDSKTILTAAHCVQGEGTVSVVRYNTLYYEDNGILDLSSKIIIHPEFNNQTGENDIAIIKLSKQIKLGLINSGTVCLPNKNSIPRVGTALTVSGWGNTALNGEQPYFLMTVNVFVANQTACITPFGLFDVAITDTVICAAGNRKGVCDGDSGGSLVDFSSGRAVIVGIVSKSYFCGTDNVPGVYTRVSAYLNFINKLKN